MKQLFDTQDNCYCPICDRTFSSSGYLKEIFQYYEKTRWFANMVTHYRHTHITSWNKCWGNQGRYYRSNWFGDYDDEKEKVNERAKRQILRKAKDFLNVHEFKPEHVIELQNTDNKTIELANKLLTFKSKIK